MQEDSLKGMNFNSIKVQLKPIEDFGAAVGQAYFNSIKVQLKQLQSIDVSTIS